MTPLPKVRRWIAGYLRDAERVLPIGNVNTWGKGKDRAFNFLTLVELFAVFQLRERGVSLKAIRQARAELGERFDIEYPFAHQGIVSDGRKILFELPDGSTDAYLELGTVGQTSFRSVMRDFCQKLEFHESTLIADKYWPLGQNHAVVVDPEQSFGRPIISGTNIKTEAIHSLLLAGETVETIAHLYQLDPEQVTEAELFERQQAA
jgi:uncharacterized protein (DUF433 family)